MATSQLKSATAGIDTNEPKSNAFSGITNFENNRAFISLQFR